MTGFEPNESGGNATGSNPRRIESVVITQPALRTRNNEVVVLRAKLQAVSVEGLRLASVVVVGEGL